MVTGYKPRKSDIIVINFDPQAGHEQKGRRPALVVSNADFHKRTNLVMVCPITNTLSGFPSHVPLDGRTRIQGEVMCEQVKSLDIYARNAAFVEALPADLMEEVTDILCAFIE
jgi:mRNA interferase MazF